MFFADSIATGQPPRSDASPDRSRPVFSGPQAGEPLPEVPVLLVQNGDEPARHIDLSALSRKYPVVIMFMHEKSRPAFGLARLMAAFADKYHHTKLQFYVVILTNDPADAERWLRQVRRYFPGTTHLAVADGGIEGPGALGLNRLVAVTVLMAHNVVTKANYALTQVSGAVDGPKVLQSMSELIGGVPVPAIEELLPERTGRMQRARPPQKRSDTSDGSDGDT